MALDMFPVGLNSPILPALNEVDLFERVSVHINELQSILDKNGKFPPNELTIPTMAENISTQGIPYNCPLSKNEILSLFGERFKLCLEKNHQIYYMQKFESNKEGTQLFTNSKLACGTCLSQVIQFLFNVMLVKPLINQSATTIQIPLPFPVPVPVKPVTVTGLRIPGEQAYIFDCQNFHQEMSLRGNFGSAIFKEYIHIPTNKPVLCKIIKNQNTPQFNQILNEEINLRNNLNVYNFNQVATLYGIGFNTTEHAWWLAMESIDVTLDELNQYYIHKNKTLPETLLAGIANVVLNILKNGVYASFPVFNLTPNTIGLTWKGEIKIFDYPEFNLGPTINHETTLDKRINNFSINADDWRKLMLAHLSQFLSDLIRDEAVSKNLLDFISDCRKEDFEYLLNRSRFCKQYKIPCDHQDLLEELSHQYEDFVKTSWHQTKKISNLLQAIDLINMTNEKLILENCDRLFLNFFILYSENVEIENQQELLQNVFSFLFKSGENLSKILTYVDHLQMKISFASDDDSSKLEICQKCSGMFFFKKLVESLPEPFINEKCVDEAPKIKEFLQTEMAQTEENLKIWSKNIGRIDQEYIPKIISEHYKEGLWWWFPIKKKLRSENRKDN